MELRLDDKVAVVTGGSRGIGLAIATEYANSGAQVMIVSRKADACEAAAAEIGHGCIWMAGNVGDADFAEAAIDRAVSDFGRVDVLVNNAATNPYAGPIIDVDLPRWEKTLQVNLTAPLLWTQLAWQKSMRDGDGGCSVIHVSSVGGLATSEMLGVYNLTKSGLMNMTRQLAAEMGPKVRVNAVAPGLIKTDFAKMLWEGDRGDEVAKAYPLGRLGETADIAGAAMYLAAETGSWITGETIILDGGGLVSLSRGGG